MTTIIDTLTDFYFELINHKKVTPETAQNYKQTFYDFCNLYGLKETKRINASHILKYRNHISKRITRRKSQTGCLSQRTVYANMNRLKAYFKWLYEKGMLEDIKLSEFPINKTVAINPAYLTKAELKFIFNELDKSLLQNEYQLKKRDYVYASYQLRAMLHLLYATGLRNAELRKLKHSDMDIGNMTGTVIGKGAKQNNFTFNIQAKKALVDYLAVKEKYYSNSEKHMQYLFTSANF